MGKIKQLSGKILYGLLFVMIIPSLLILWARETGHFISLPVPGHPDTGYFVLAAGVLFIISGMFYIWFYGKGLPMNAFPPEKFVSNGIYAFTKHPIYSGAVLVSFGLSVITRSASGFWLVSPLFTLMIVAFVSGFENERTETIFGIKDYKTFLSLPADDNAYPKLKERISAFLIVFVPWLVIYEAFVFIGPQADALYTNLPFEEHWRVNEFSEIFYLFTYVFVLPVPFIILTRSQLRSFIIDLWFIIVITGLIFLLIPFVVKQKEFVPQTFLGQLILFDRSLDRESAALPSFHVIWAFVAARYYAANIDRTKWIWYTIAVLISISCIGTGNHSLADVIAGLIIFLAALYRHQIWNLIRSAAEWLANSWHEWRWGPVRIINHGFYGGAAGIAGTLIAGSFLGSRYTAIGFSIMIFVIIGAGLWAQFIEGSPKLLRPYGYYGGITGGLIACLLASFIFSIDIFFLIGSMVMSAPWIQAIGRLRCLVQGCCHGKPTGEKTGIRFTHPNSRVNKISGLAGTSLHPTQLYSIACNLVTGMILIRLYTLHMPAVFITGIYLIMNGLGRFVEESLRGEAQTPYWAGMRIYQWVAIVNVIIGILFTVIPSGKTLLFQFNIESVFLAIITGMVVTIASGVDFPGSNRRFARLTST
jgi:protein-S-isoprenylcysteine O-methyltransferase Ste14